MNKFKSIFLLAFVICIVFALCSCDAIFVPVNQGDHEAGSPENSGGSSTGTPSTPGGSSSNTSGGSDNSDSGPSDMPSTPDNNDPSTPDKNDPDTPDNNGSDVPGNNDPDTPDNNDSDAPGNNDSDTPGSDTPTTPRPLDPSCSHQWMGGYCGVCDGVCLHPTIDRQHDLCAVCGMGVPDILIITIYKDGEYFTEKIYTAVMVSVELDIVFRESFDKDFIQISNEFIIEIGDDQIYENLSIYEDCTINLTTRPILPDHDPVPPGTN